MNEESICFIETLFRMIKTNEANKLKVKYTYSNMFGKATKRVLNDKNKEVAKNSL